MSQGTTSPDLNTQSQALLQGPLKHARTAALALALVPLAAVAASTLTPGDTACPSAGLCGTVFFDQNGNGIQDAGETGISGASVTITGGPGGEIVLVTNSDGFYDSSTSVPPTPLPVGLVYTVSVQIPPSTTPSPANVGPDDTIDSDGVNNGSGSSVAQILLTTLSDATTDFGFKTTTTFPNPGTGTPGYWKNHPEAWPVSSITVSSPNTNPPQTYTVQQAIDIMGTPVSKDKTYSMFAQLVSAMLNVQIGNDSTCVSEAIAAGQDWMTKYGPVGSGVAASSYAWRVGEKTHRLLDDYNNGGLCAPHRD